jgi:hypothetical protein
MTERETYSHYLRWIISDVVDVLDELGADQRRWRPIETANDALTIVRHVIGGTRAYAIELGCGVPTGRDREAEFRPGDDDDGLADRLRELSGEVELAFAALSDSSLDLPAEALTEWRGTDPPTGSRRDVIVRSIRHAGIHLGELGLTADLAKRASAAPNG